MDTKKEFTSVVIAGAVAEVATYLMYKKQERQGDEDGSVSLNLDGDGEADMVISEHEISLEEKIEKEDASKQESESTAK